MYSDEEEGHDNAGMPELETMLKMKGYDGFTYPNTFETSKSGKLEKSYAVFDPEQIKSAIGNRGTFNPRDPRMQYMPDWYSPTAKVIAQKMPEKAPAKQVLALLSGGNKAEVEWSGAKDFVESHGDKPVSKQAVLDFLNKGLPQIKETKLSDVTSTSINEVANREFGKNYPDLSWSPDRRAVMDQFNADTAGTPVR